LFEAGDDAAVRVALGARELRRYAGRAYLLPALAGPARGIAARVGRQARMAAAELGGTLRFVRRQGAGLACARVREPGLNLRLRQGGEKLRLQAKALRAA